MKLAAAPRRQFEDFFREYLRNEDFRLPVIYFYAGRLTRIFTNLIGVHGITFGRRIFINPKLVSLNRNGQPQLPKNLAAHEIAHVLQYERRGYIKFLFKYFSAYQNNLRNFEKRDAFAKQSAYLEIPAEIEARIVAAKFVEWWKAKSGE